MVFRSHRAIFGRVDHDILVRNFVRAGLSRNKGVGRTRGSRFASETSRAAVLGFPVVKAPLADTLTTGCFHRVSIRFHG
jgi:hypothetical protein